MSASATALLVESNARQAREVCRAIESLALREPVVASCGEDAIRYAMSYPCAVAVIDYRLPGIDGLETLMRLHTRRPDLPVVMTSSANSEDVAIAAFHAGVVDYVPKRGGYAEVVAALVQQIMAGQSPAETGGARYVAIGGDVPSNLLRPTYENRLRVVGRHLDLAGYRAINMSEVAGGFHVRALAAGSRQPEALEFSDRDLMPLMANAIAARGTEKAMRPGSPLLPTGYEDFLRALGYTLDQRQAEAITITEFDHLIAVGGAAPQDGPRDVTIEPFHDVLRREDVADLLSEAVRRRAKSRVLRFMRLGNG